MGQVDVLAYLDAQIASHQALSADAYHQQELPKAQEVRAAVADALRVLALVAAYSGTPAREFRAMAKRGGWDGEQSIGQFLGHQADAALTRCGVSA